MAEKKDVDLYDELDKTLNKSEAEEADGASAEKPIVDDKTKKEDVKVEDENAELSEEEISKLSPRAQNRIRDLAQKVKELAEKPAEKSPESPKEDDKKPAQDFKSVREFLDAVEDEPSRNLLEKFYTVIKGETSTILAPVEKSNNLAKFNETFAQYKDVVEGLADHEDDLLKTFMRNPNQSLKALIGETVLELHKTKIKPTDKTLPTPKHDGKIDLDGKSKDELYDILDSTRE